MVGELIAGRYELEKLVGSGGMSNVFRAHDRLLERTVALKILHEQYTRDDDYVERFRREARAVAKLAHPNIVTVIDRGEQDGRQFIVFEYVDGPNLKDLTRDGPLEVREAIDLTLQVARALSFAHERGLVHRDVKPQNVLLNDDGQAKVTDFGIARSLDVQGVTQTGTVLGTSDYIAPEQARGQRVDPKTDIYSLGAVLYELLVGDVPFSGDNFVAVAMRHVNEPVPSVLEDRPDCPARLDLAIQTAMAKDPDDRFESMDDFAAELEACLAELDGRGDEGATMIVPPARRAPRRAARRPRTPSRSRRCSSCSRAPRSPSARTCCFATTAPGGVASQRGSSVRRRCGCRSRRRGSCGRRASTTTRSRTRPIATRRRTGRLRRTGASTSPASGLVVDAGQPGCTLAADRVSDTPGSPATDQGERIAHGRLRRRSRTSKRSARARRSASTRRARSTATTRSGSSCPNGGRAQINEVTART